MSTAAQRAGNQGGKGSPSENKGIPAPPRSGPQNTKFESTDTFRKIDSLKQGPYGATDIILFLLKHTAKEAGPLTRSSFTLNALFNGLLEAHDRILKTINDIDHANNDAINWDAFNAYTDAIPVLEQFLLDIRFVVVNENYYGHVPSGQQTSVSGFTDFIADWERLRDMVLEIAVRMQGAPALKALEIQLATGTLIEKAVHNDDMVMTGSLLDQLSRLQPTNPFFKNRIGNKLLDSVKTLISGVETSFGKVPPSDQHVRKWIIKGLLLVLVPFTLLESSGLAPDVQIQLKTEEVGNAIKGMISGIGNTIRSGTLDKLPELYQVLLSVLEKSPGLLSLKKDIDNLIKYIGRIRRPFLARSIELVKIVRELDAYSKKAENRATTDREVLRDAILKLSEAFSNTIKGVEDVRTFPMAKEDGKYKAAEDLYDEALDALDDCIDNFGFEGRDINDRYTDAAEKDDLVLQQFRTRIGS